MFLILAGPLLAEIFYKASETKMNAALATMRGVKWVNMRKVTPAMIEHPNMKAFLMVIRKGESSMKENAFTMLNGGEQFSAPPWNHPNRVGKGGTSTAAGAYQFVIDTWRGISLEMGLKDFSPENQKRAAVYNMAYLGAVPDVIAGNLAAACKKTSIPAGWESLPGGKRQRQTLAQAAAVFAAYGGVIGK